MINTIIAIIVGGALILIGLAIILFILLIISHFTTKVLDSIVDYYFSSEYNSYPRFTFKEWHDIFSLKPKAWEIRKDCDVPFREELIPGFIPTSKRYYVYWKSWRDLRRYRFWSKKYLRDKIDRENRQARNEATEKLIKLAQADIKEIKAQAEKEFEQAKQEYQEIVETMIDPDKNRYGTFEIPIPYTYKSIITEPIGKDAIGITVQL